MVDLPTFGNPTIPQENPIIFRPINIFKDGEVAYVRVNCQVFRPFLACPSNVFIDIRLNNNFIDI